MGGLGELLPAADLDELRRLDVEHRALLAARGLQSGAKYVDILIAAPKSVSIAYAQVADDQPRFADIIQEAHWVGVAAVTAHIRTLYPIYARAGGFRNAPELVEAELRFQALDHLTADLNRSEGPHIHTHLILDTWAGEGMGRPILLLKVYTTLKQARARYLPALEEYLTARARVTFGPSLDGTTRELHEIDQDLMDGYRARWPDDRCDLGFPQH